MNISELARKLKVNPNLLRELLPQMGFHIGAKAIKIDDKTAQKVMLMWRDFYKKWELSQRTAEEEVVATDTESNEIKQVYIPKLITVKDFASKTDTPVNSLIKVLMKNGILASLNDNIDFESASIVGDDLGWEVLLQEDVVEIESNSKEKIKEAIDSSANVGTRPPVVVVMGHVDHGKTKILDAIRETNVVEGESGGITQHIGAYTVKKNNKDITFIDTPGHEAFTAMRSRGAKVADIAIIVVAADDGVQPQTREVIDIVTAARLPFVVAMNKMDKPEADPEKIKRELAEANLIPEDWGGKTIIAPVSAKTGEGIDGLLDTILLVADMEAKNIRADKDGQTVASVIESHVDKGEGIVATLLIQNGTLRINNYLRLGDVLYGRIKAMKNWKGEDLKEAGPSTPVKILGLKIAPEVGDVLSVTKDIKGLNREVKRIFVRNNESSVSKVSKEDSVDKEILNIILRADVLGSIEAILGSVEQFSHPKIGIKVIHKGLGNITDTDLDRASSANTIIYGFHVKLDTKIAENAREKKVDIRMFEIIYDLLGDVKKELEKILKPEIIKNELGRLKVLAIFKADKNGKVIGCRVAEGKVTKDSKFDLLRDSVKIDIGSVLELQSGKQNVTEVVSPNECGLKVNVGQDVEVDDILHTYQEQHLEQKIELK